MSGKIRKLARATRRYRVTRRLEVQGGQPAGLYAHQVLGVSGCQLKRCRRRLADACAPRMAGRCVTSLLSLAAPGRDPALKCPRECLQMWLQTWIEVPLLRSSLQRAWPLAVQKLEGLDPSVRARHVRRPQAAAILYLLQH